MIRSDSALLRHIQDFFLSDLVGLYRWDRVQIAAPERREAIPPNIGFRERRKMMEQREGLGRYLEQARVRFDPWEILVYSSMERPPLGEVVLRVFHDGTPLITGPLDPATWNKIGEYLRQHQNRKAS